MDADDWDKRYEGHQHLWGHEPNQFVRELCERLPIGDAVDLACGEGRNALWLARLGWRVVGVDFSRTAIERAMRVTASEPAERQQRISWHVADVRTHEVKAESTDLAIISYAHLFADESADLISRAAHAVRPEGHLVVVGHDRRNLAEGVGGPQDGSLLYVPADVAAIAVDAGLDVELAETVPRTTDAGIALDTIVRARRPRLA